MILMPILLMNLLIGLAVGDIESVRRNAQLKRLAMQVVLHTELERKLPQIWLEKIDKNELIEYPNEAKCKLGFLDSMLRKWLCNPFNDTGNGKNSNKIRFQKTVKLQTVFFSGLRHGPGQQRRFRRIRNGQTASQVERHVKAFGSAASAAKVDCSGKTDLPALSEQFKTFTPKMVSHDKNTLVFKKLCHLQKMEIKTEADDVDEGVSVKEIRPLSALLSDNPSRWSSPRIRKKLRSALSFNKNLN